MASGLGSLNPDSLLRSPEAATGRLGAVLRAVGESGPARLGDDGPWLATTLDQARAVLTDPVRFVFPMDVSRKPAQAPRDDKAPSARRTGPRTPHSTFGTTAPEDVALGRTVFAESLDRELGGLPPDADIDAAVILRRPVARATTAAVLRPLLGAAPAAALRDSVADAVLEWIDALAPVISTTRNPSRWSRVRRNEDRSRRTLERLLIDAGLAEPGAVATVLAAGVQVPVAAGAWLLVHLAAGPTAAAQEPIHVVWETLRVTPPTWVTARMAATDAEVGGQQLNAGELVLVSPLLLGQVSSLVPTSTSPALDFEPARWSRSDVRPGAWLPFGAGPHACPGRSLGLALLADLAGRAQGWGLSPVLPARVDQSRGLFPVPALVRRQEATA